MSQRHAHILYMANRHVERQLFSKRNIHLKIQFSGDLYVIAFELEIKKNLFSNPGWIELLH